MRTLTYSPSVEVYACHVGRGESRDYYDLSNDIVSCDISLTMDGTSSLSLTLQNVGGKYNGLFMPMDLICAYATKVGKVRVFTGYINSVSEFTLYPRDFTLKAMDANYRLNRFYWDEGLGVVQGGFLNETSKNPKWSGFDGVISRLLNSVAGVSFDRIHLGKIPVDFEQMARSMYAAGVGERANAAKVNADFRKALGSASSVFGSGTSNTSGGTAYTGGPASVMAVESYVRWMGRVADDPGVGYSQDRRCMNPDVDCSSFVYYALLNNGWTDEQMTGGSGYPWTTWTMEERLTSGCGFTRFDFDGDISRLQRGDIFVLDGYGRDGYYHEHTEVYWGDGQTIGAHKDELGGIHGPTGGDQDGGEVSVVPISPCWTQFWRYIPPATDESGRPRVSGGAF